MPAPESVPDASASADAPAEAPAAAPVGTGSVPNLDVLAGAWVDDLLEKMSRKGRARFSAGRFIAVEDGTAVMGLPNEPHRKRCEDLRGELEAVLADRFQTTISVRLVVDDGPIEPRSAAGAKTASAPRQPEADDEVDLSALVDADAAEGSAVERLTQAFPGAALVDPD